MKLLLCISLLFAIIIVLPVTGAGSEYSYSFVLLSDLQGLTFFPDTYNLTFEEIESLKSTYNITGIFISGDLTDGNFPEDYIDYNHAISHTTIPVYETSGNHDVQDRVIDWTYWDTYVPDGENKHNYGFVYEDFVFYGLGWNGEPYTGINTTAQSEMEDFITDHPGKVALILSHGYFVPYEGEVTGDRDDIAYAILESLDKLDRHAIISSGHTHTETQLFFNQLIRYNNITVIEDFQNAQDWKFEYNGELEQWSIGRIYQVVSDGRAIKSINASEMYMWPGSLVINNTVTYTPFSQAPVRPVTSFSANTTSGTSPLAVTFTDSSTNSPTDWDWYWYANETKSSDAQNPAATLKTGVYNVRLYSSNSAGGDWENKTAYITVIPGTVDATSGIAIVRNTTGYWYLDYDLDGTIDKSFRYGQSTDQIIAGDWQGTQSDGITIFRPSSGYWYFDYNLDGLVDKSFRFGGSTDRTISGDWQGTGRDSIAIFRPSSGYWYFDYNLDGLVDKSFRFGGSADQIIAGDWQGTGRDGIAIFRPATGYWYFDFNLDGTIDKFFRYGQSTDRIIAGDWQGTGRDGIAIFRPATGYWYFDFNLDGTIDKSIRYGQSTDQIIAGDWEGTGQDGIATFRPSSGYWYFDTNLDGIVDKSFRYGGATDRIIAGKWAR